MTNVPNGPTVNDLARRVQRVEDKLDERIVTTDMLQAVKELLRAEVVTLQVTVNSLEKRIQRLEGTLSRVNFALLGAFLTLLVLIILQLVSVTGGTK